MAIQNLNDLKQYILIQLGAPVIHIEIPEIQLDVLIEDSIQIFQKYNTGDGNYEDYMTFPVTAGVSAYNIPDDLETVAEIRVDNAATSGINVLFSPQHIIMTGGTKGYVDWGMGQSYSSQSFSLTSYEVATQQLEQVKDTFQRMYYGRYLRGERQLTFFPPPNEDGIAFLRVFRRHNAIYIYNDDLLKRLCVAKAKIQWGTNLKKFNMVLPTGATINWQDILQEGKDDLAAIMEAIVMESEPSIFCMA